MSIFDFFDSKIRSKKRTPVFNSGCKDKNKKNV